MIQVFEKYRHKFEPYRLFERFMEFVINGFDVMLSAIEKPFSKEESEACMELLNAWIMSMNEALKHKEWYDLLGEIYMNYLASTMKKQWTGQFFTPMHISDLMAKITGPGEVVGERIMNCACGSGRMLLAAHVLHPGNYCCAQDLDRICCLMTVCNFIIHGVNGEVICGDSLNPADYRDGWRTNELLNVIGMPTVRKMSKEESSTYIGSLSTMSESKVVASNAKSKPTKVEPVQLSLFE